MAEGTQVKLKLVEIVLVATTGFAQQGPHTGELWRNIRNVLTGADGDRYFKQQLEGAELPRLDGKVVSQPSAHELIVNVDDPAGDARLQFLLALKGTIAAGTSVHFRGVARSYTNNPYQLTLAILEDDKIEGLPPGATR
jgi:hypothetical protein